MTVFATQSDIQMSGPGLLGSDVAGVAVRKSKRITIGDGLTLVDGVLTNTLDLSGYLPLAGGTLTGDLKFTDATYDIGKSGATRPRDGFFSRNIQSALMLPEDGALILGSLAYSDRTNISSAGILAYLKDFSIQTGTGYTINLISGSDVITQRRSTNAQTFRLAATYTSATSFGALQFKANTDAAYQIGSAIGSAGGNNRDVSLGQWDSAGAFSTRIHITTAGNVGVNHGTVGYLRDVFQVNTTSTATTFGGANTSAQGITITNSTNTMNRPVGLQFSGYEGWAFGGIFGTMTSSGGNTYGRISIALRSATAGSYAEVCRWDENACLLVTPWASNSGSPVAFTVTGAAHTTLTASTEATDVNFNLARTVQFANGAITTQRAFRIQAPVYSHVSGSNTITTASTVSISGPPTTTGGFTTITNAYALNVESGKSYFGDHVIVPSGKCFGGSAHGFGIGSAGANIPSVGYFGVFKFEFGDGIFCATSAIGLGTTLTGYGATGADTLLYRDAAGVLALRNSTTAQKFRIYATYTSSTAFESLTFAPTTSSVNIGLEVGSAGGTNTRNINIGHYDTSGTFITRFTCATSVTQAISDSTCVFRLYGHGNVATGTQIQCYKARGTDRNTKNYPLSGDVIGGLNCYGYDESAANWSSSKGAYIISTSGDWTSTANGTQHTWQVTDSSDATKTLTTVMTLTTGGVLTPLCGVNYSKIIRQSSEITNTPSGTTQTLTLNNGNHQTLSLVSATGTVTATLTVPTSSSAGTIIVLQHASAAKDITWAVSSGSIKWMGTEPDWATDATSSYRLVSWRWNGSIMFLASTDVGT